MTLHEIWSLMKSTSISEFENVNVDEIVLSAKLDTLKRLTCQHLSMLHLMRKSIPVLINKQSSLLAEDKIKTIQSMKRISWQYWYDSFNLTERILSITKLCEKMYFGMTQYQNQPTELWHSWAWKAFICATSKEYAYTLDTKPLFSEDLVQFHRREEVIKKCITFVEKDFWNNASEHIILTV